MIEGDLRCNLRIFVEVLIVDKNRLRFFSWKYLYKINVTNRSHRVVGLFLLINQDALLMLDVQ
jgi:hypothetical protein